MTEHKSKLKLNKAFIAAAVVLALAAGVLTMALAELARIDDGITRAGADSVEETYTEVSHVLTEVSYARYNYLHILGDYLRDTHAGDATIRAMLVDRQAEFGYTDFYFVDESGGYISLEGERGHIDVGRQLDALVDETRDIFVDATLPRRDSMLFYIVTVKPGTYQDFPYCAIAFGYDKQDMTNLLRVAAFGGESSTYVTYNNGRVAMAMQGAQLTPRNVLALLRREGLDEEEQTVIEQDFTEARTGNALVSIEGRDYYLNYQPLEFTTMLLVSLTPTEAANAAIVNIQQSTIRLVLSVLVIAALVVLLGGAIWAYRIVSNKNSQLYERELIFSLVAKNADECYILYNLDEYRVKYASPNVERLIGVTRSELDASIYALKNCFENEADWDRCNIMRSLAVGEIKRFEQVLRSPITKEKSLYAVEMYRLDGEHSADVILTIADRRREQAIRTEIEEALTLAKEANKSKSAFLSNMSHDIRTPMNAIIGFTTLLSKNPTDALKVTGYTAKIAAASKHLLSLINDVLDMSKIEAGKLTLNLETVDIAELLQELSAMIVSQARSKELAFDLQTELTTPAAVEADRLRLSQVLLNILSNAIKYTPAGGSVTLSATSEPQNDGKLARFTFTVTDTGIGMSREYLEHIFMPFTRESTTTTNKIQGTGLGMSITYSMVQLMGGTITVDSEQGVGSTFTVTLAFPVVEQAKPAAITDYEEEFDITGLRLLAAEDNELNAEILGELLEDEGVTCDIVENGELAVEKFTSAAPGTYDAILMDVQMPVLNGYDATRQIRASDHPEAKTIPIIAMTANAFIEDVQDAIAAGMNEHLAKPIYINGLKQKLRLVLTEQ